VGVKMNYGPNIY